MELKEFEQFLRVSFNIMVLFSLILVFFSIYKKKILFSSNLKAVFCFILFSGILYLLEWLFITFIFKKTFYYWCQIKPFLKNNKIQDTNFIGSIHYLVKFTLLGLLFSNLFKSEKISSFYKLLMFGLVAFELLRIFYFKSYQSYDSLSSTLKNIFILSGSGLLLFSIYKADISNISLYKNTYFWIAFALFITALSELFLEFIFTKLHDSDLVGFYKLYLVRNALQVMFFLLMIVGFLNTKYLRYLPKKY